MIESRKPATDSADSRKLRRLVKRRKPINHKDVPFILCWSHKAGCTAALKWYLHHAGLLDDALSMHDPNHRLKVHSYENKVLKARADYTDELVRAIETGKPMLGFMRCPYQRVFSSYMILNHWRYLSLMSRGVSNPGITMRQTLVANVYDEQAPFHQPISFMDYLNWLRHQNMHTLNPHHAPQTLPLHAHVDITFYRLDDFDGTITAVEREYGLKISSANRADFSSGHHRNKTVLPKEEVLGFLETRRPLQDYPLSALPQLSKSILAGTDMDRLIREIFADDIAAYDRIPALT